MCLTTNSRKDPTQTGPIRARAIRELKRRRDGAERDLVKFVQSLEQYATREVVQDGRVVNRVVYRYELLPGINPDAEIRRIIERWFAPGSEKPDRYFFDQFIAQAYTQGGTIEADRLSRLAGSIDDMTAQQVQGLLQSPAFRQRIEILSSRVFEQMRDFSGDAGTPLRIFLADQMAQGRGVRSIVADMRKEWDKQATYRLERIARTEISHAHREARHDMDKDARDRLGLQVKEQWISQLSPTTRPSHAEQHLRIMEIEEVAAVYAEIGEINCLCSQQAVIVSEDGELLGERKKTKRDEEEVARIVGKA